MTIKPSGSPLSLSEILAEFGGTNPTSLSEYYGAAGGIPTSGRISVSDFYGKTSVVLERITSSRTGWRPARNARFIHIFVVGAGGSGGMGWPARNVGTYGNTDGVAGELQVPIWSASQSNRAAMDEDIIQANNISDSYRKIMTADFVMSLSRKMSDKQANTARFHVIKNRFGPDGITFPARMNAGCGDIRIFAENSREGMGILNEMSQEENVVKKMMSNKWNAHSTEDSE